MYINMAKNKDLKQQHTHFKKSLLKSAPIVPNVKLPDNQSNENKELTNENKELKTKTQTKS